MWSQIKVGINQILGSGVPVTPRADFTGAAVVTDAHARYQEEVLQGNVFTAAVTNATVAAAGAVTNPLLAIINPPNSGKNYVILKVGVAPATASPGTAGIGGIGLYMGVATTSSGSANVTPINNLNNASTSTASCYAAVSSALSAVLKFMRAIGGVIGAPTNTFLNIEELMDGEIIVPPGSAFAINPVTSAGTTWVLSAFIVYAELQQTPPQGY